MDFPLLQARQLCFTYGERPVLRDLHLELAVGSCTLIQGGNGAGKSSLLQLLQGRLHPSAGSVHLAGRPLRGQRHRLALVPQTPSLRWHYPIHLAGLVGLGRGGRVPCPAPVAVDLSADRAPMPPQAITDRSVGLPPLDPRPHLLTFACRQRMSWHAG